LIYRLRRLGWTQQEIADELKIEQQRVAQIEITNFNKFIKISEDLLQKG